MINTIHDYPLLDTFTTLTEVLGQGVEVAVSYEYSPADPAAGVEEWLDLFDVELRLWTRPPCTPDGRPTDGRESVATASILDVLTKESRDYLIGMAWQHLREQRLLDEADYPLDWPVAA